MVVLTPALVQAGAPDLPKRDTVGVVRGIGGSGQGNPALWLLRASTDRTCTGANITRFGFGDDGDTVLTMDLSNDTIDQATVFRTSDGFGSFFVRANNDTGAQSATRINFGAVGDIPIVGNFDPSDAGDEVGVFRPSTNQFFLLEDDFDIIALRAGTTGDLPVVGNWDGSVDGSDEVGVYRPSTSQFFSLASNSGGASISARTFGASGDTSLSGDWDADDTTTQAVYRDEGGSIGGTFYFTNVTSGGTADSLLRFGATGTDRPVTGDFDGTTADEDGCPAS
ncbi:MAG: hypothetical protein CL931_04180 [Deltaproteobacteria bacterium]|nr:hypothetical protein [Deltaproteobacteria bacterium]